MTNTNKISLISHTDRNQIGKFRTAEIERMHHPYAVKAIDAMATNGGVVFHVQMTRPGCPVVDHDRVIFFKEGETKICWSMIA